jgi:hypothetical protein
MVWLAGAGLSELLHDPGAECGQNITSGRKPDDVPERPETGFTHRQPVVAGFAWRIAGA